MSIRRVSLLSKCFETKRKDENVQVLGYCSHAVHSSIRKQFDTDLGFQLLCVMDKTVDNLMQHFDIHIVESLVSRGH